MELNYRSPRIDPPSDPWDESFAGCFHPVDALLEPGANLQLDQSDHGTATYRLIPELRQAAQTMDPAQILARAAEAFLFAAHGAETILDERAATARGNAFADLAVTGRMAYEAFRAGVDVQTVKEDTVALLDMPNAVWRGKWTTGWTNFEIFPMGGKTYMFAYKAGDGTATFDEIPTDLQNTKPLWRGTWTTGWTNFEIFPMGGKTYMFAYKAGDGTATFDEIPTDLQNTKPLWRGTWTTGWTNFEIFPMGGKTYMFAYKAGDGTATFDEIPTDLQNTKPLWRGTWTTGWTNFEIFPMGGKTYMFAYKAGDGTATFDEIPTDLQNTKPLWRGTWTTGWTNFEIFPMGGKTYMFAYKAGDGTATFDEIPTDLQNTKPLWRGTWTTGWTNFEIFAMGGKTYMFAYKAGDGTATFDEIPTELENTDRLPAYTDAEIGAAVETALERAYAVAWALRGPPAQQAALRAPLGWIAVSGEDDKPHRPVNVPPPPYEQYEVLVPTEWQDIATRFFIASAVEPRARTATPQARQPPDDPPAPTVPDEHKVILFLHGHSSGADEAMGIIPALLQAGLDRGVRYSVLSVDLPNNGYSQEFDHLAFSPRSESTYPKDPADQTHINAPVLDFIENFVVDFVDSLPTSISAKLVAVIGGSLGGNLTLRLGRRDLTGKSWTIPAIVSWDPASVWPPKVAHVIEYMAPNSCFDQCGADEVSESRDDFFFQSYLQTHALGMIHPQPDYWYRDGWVGKPFHIAQSKFARFEIYSKFFRQWHWRVAGEQLIYSHIDNEIFRDGNTPFRYEKNFVPTLLVAGAYDDYLGTNIYSNTIFLSERIPVAGRRLLLNTTGHSVHFERPVHFAREIVKFLNAQTWFITCVKRKDGEIETYGVKMSTDPAEQPVQQSLNWCIERIEQGDDLYTVGSDGSQGYVRVAHRKPVGLMGDPGGENRGYYLRTVGDVTTMNNIESLSECE